MVGRPPYALLIHLGGSDLAKRSGKSIVLDSLRDLRSWKTKYLFSRIVWSTLIPQHVWRAYCDASYINRAHRKVNREAGRAVVNG